MTILQTTTVAIPILLFILGTITCFIVAFVIAISDIDSDIARWIVIISLMVGLILAVLALVITGEKTRYQVLLDDTYPVSKLYENYEIVEQEGITYWIEEKDNED